MTTNRKKSAKRRASRYLHLVLPLFLSACSASQTPVSIDFSASWQGLPIGCDSTGVSLTDLRFFVSELIVTDTSGRDHELRLNPNGPWQSAEVALIDLESGDGSCQNGTPQIHATVTGTTTANEVAAVRFVVGVPFNLNHADPLQTEPPLDQAAMHWHWRSGYKFLRAGVATATDGFWIHLGSTACQGSVRNISGCNSPNRVLVKLPHVSSSNINVNIDLAELFATVDFDDGEASDCSSSPAEESCAGLFDKLGLPFNETARNGEQSVFELRP